MDSRQPSPASSSTTSVCVIEEVGSYSQCEGHIFGRQSFGGFNPVLEQNVRKGIWRPFYIDPTHLEDEDEELDSETKKKDMKDEMDVDDEEMAKHYGSLVATLGKRFAKKGKNQSGSDGPPNKRIKMDPNVEENKKKKGGGWKGLFKSGKKGQEDTSEAKSPGGGGRRRGGRRGKNSKQSQEEKGQTDPKKKRKFMKPKDD